MNNGLVQVCGRCGQQWLTTHYCAALHAPDVPGAQVVKVLTEADVRRIVREELQIAGRLKAGTGA